MKYTASAVPTTYSEYRMTERRNMELNFRELRADELEARIARYTDTGAQILLYKNARCDMKVLDEAVGPMNWQRDHKELKNNMYAGIGIYDKEKSQWIWKWDCGTESNMQGEKGEASDSFKRAGFNWGIGRELYTAPFIWFSSSNMKDKYDRFSVEAIEYEDGKISYLKVIDRETKKKFISGRSKKLQPENIDDPIDNKEYKHLMELIGEANVNVVALTEQYNVDSLKEVTRVQYEALISKLKKALKKGDK